MGTEELAIANSNKYSEVKKKAESAYYNFAYGDNEELNRLVEAIDEREQALSEKTRNALKLPIYRK